MSIGRIRHPNIPSALVQHGTFDCFRAGCRCDRCAAVPDWRDHWLHLADGLLTWKRYDVMAVWLAEVEEGCGHTAVSLDRVAAAAGAARSTAEAAMADAIAAGLVILLSERGGGDGRRHRRRPTFPDGWLQPWSPSWAGAAGCQCGRR